MKIVFVCFCLAWICSAWANPPPDLVYRMDTRPPEEIFRDGFIPVGHNTNLYEHVEGFTCYGGDRTSGFVATTEDESFANDWGRWWLPNGSHYFVYRLRPTAHFYSTTTSLMHAYRSEGREVYRLAAERFIEQGEWVSRGRIPAISIIDATEYISRGPGELPPTRVTIHTNTQYVEAIHEVNTQPYVWNTDEDAVSESSAQQLFCDAACFGSSISLSPEPRKKRELDRSTAVIDHVRSCRRTVTGRMAALISTFTETVIDKPMEIVGVSDIEEKDP